MLSLIELLIEEVSHKDFTRGSILQWEEFIQVQKKLTVPTVLLLKTTQLG
jgi:hypothetical protein